MVLGLALIASGVIVLYALRRALWRRLDDDAAQTPPSERVHYVGPGDDRHDAVDIPLDGGEYGSRPIYVPPERGTVYVSRTTEPRDQVPFRNPCRAAPGPDDDRRPRA